MSKQVIGKANWLHISSHALSLYVQEGGQLAVHITPGGVQVLFTGVTSDDPAWHRAFLDLLRPDGEAEEK